MNRLTRKTQTGYEVADIDKAIARLGAYEDLHERIETEQANIPSQLDKLRAAGKEKTATFKELVGRRLQNVYVLMLLDDESLK